MTQTVPDSASLSTSGVTAGATQIGWATCVDDSGSVYAVAIAYNSATSVRFLRLVASDTNLTHNTISATTPHTWANSDSIEWYYTARLA